MNKYTILVTFFAAICAPVAHALTFDFVSDGNPGAKIVFSGATDSFQFTPADSNYDFVIRSSDASSLVGLTGNFGGVYTIGAITTTGGLQTANVTGSGTLSIFDGSTTLTANLTWNSIFSFGTIVGLNDVGLPNISNISYSGTNAGLLQMLTDNLQTANLSTQFIPGKSLTQLTADNSVASATYSGTYNSVVPEPATLSVLGLGLLAARRRRK